MNKQDRLIDYLYGEMTETERRDFERQLANDTELQSELADLRQTREWLAELPDRLPEATVISMPPGKSRWIKWGLRAGAAAILLLLLNMFNARVEVSRNGLFFALGSVDKTSTEVETIKNQEAMSAGIQELLAEQKRELEQKLLRMDSSWHNHLLVREQILQQGWQKQLAANQSKRRQEIEQLTQQLRKEELPELANLIQNLQVQQQQELRLLLSEFWDQWQQTRAADLQSIESELVNLYQNVELNQNETEAVLKDLLARTNI